MELTPPNLIRVGKFFINPEMIAAIEDNHPFATIFLTGIEDPIKVEKAALFPALKAVGVRSSP